MLKERHLKGQPKLGQRQSAVRQFSIQNLAIYDACSIVNLY